MVQANVNGSRDTHTVNVAPGHYQSSDHTESDTDNVRVSETNTTDLVTSDVRAMIPVMVADEVRRQQSEIARAAKQSEDKRANRRNMNRLFMLIAALVWSFIAPSLMLQLFGPIAERFDLFVTILPDAALTVYALIRKY